MLTWHFRAGQSRWLNNLLYLQKLQHREGNWLNQGHFCTPGLTSLECQSKKISSWNPIGKVLAFRRFMVSKSICSTPASASQSLIRASARRQENREKSFNVWASTRCQRIFCFNSLYQRNACFYSHVIVEKSESSECSHEWPKVMVVERGITQVCQAQSLYIDEVEYYEAVF